MGTYEVGKHYRNSRGNVTIRVDRVEYRGEGSYIRYTFIEHHLHFFLGKSSGDSIKTLDDYGYKEINPHEA